MLDKKDEQEINESLTEGNITNEHSLSTTQQDNALVDPTAFKGVDIEGLQEVPSNMQAVPYVRLVQPSSKNIVTDKGEEAKSGTYLFNDTQIAVEELYFVILRAKPELKPVDRDGKFIFDNTTPVAGEKQQLSILGYDPTGEKLFILSLTKSSFSNFGKYIAKLKSMKVKRTWEYMIKATSSYKENDKGKFYVAEFNLDLKLNDTEVEKIGKIAYQYGMLLDQRIVDDEGGE